jgi:hypothetical protein
MMGILKPKGMVVYRWCCYNPYQTSTKVLVMKESKSMEAGMSQRVVQYRVVQKMTWLAVEPLLSQSTDHKLCYLWFNKLKSNKGKVLVSRRKQVTT